MGKRAKRMNRRRFLDLAATGAASLAVGSLAVGESLAIGATSTKAAMSHRRRIENALVLEQTDRLPFGFWWHFPNRDRAPRRLAGVRRKPNRTGRECTSASQERGGNGSFALNRDKIEA